MQWHQCSGIKARKRPGGGGSNPGRRKINGVAWPCKLSSLFSPTKENIAIIAGVEGKKPRRNTGRERKREQL